MENPLILEMNLTEAQAMALAQLVKRISYRELCTNASSDSEADRMHEAVAELQDALARIGYAPR
ncbi:hypothetical protein [Acinetobacter sp. CFCC 10889]|uniref:DUF7706 family protein n=1 Tax=Acinetobacter sp. CFCC 10889 TaxID=1775557 RepID=UPI000DD07810|nr:hypothetical protein [Acinetobacter sp. CFCC 10889]